MHRRSDSQPRARFAPQRYTALLPLLLVGLGGCGGGSDIDKVVVTGTVTVDGKPIANGEIRFYPIGGTSGSVSGGPIKDGQYTAKGRGGVPVGKHRVEIFAYRSAEGGSTEGGSTEGGPAEQYLPPHFNATTELTAEVSANSTKHDFTLSLE